MPGNNQGDFTTRLPRKIMIFDTEMRMLGFYTGPIRTDVSQFYITRFKDIMEARKEPPVEQLQIKTIPLAWKSICSARGTAKPYWLNVLVIDSVDDVLLLGNHFKYLTEKYGYQL